MQNAQQQRARERAELSLQAGQRKAAPAGLGTLITGLVKSEEQANVIGSAVIIVMGLLSGTFFPVQALEAMPFVKFLPYLTLNYWAVDGFLTLAVGQTGILLNVGLLLLLGAVMFIIGWWAFNRQLDI
jgi:ABC-type multidrug transport system permease subunit